MTSLNFDFSTIIVILILCEKFSYCMDYIPRKLFYEYLKFALLIFIILDSVFAPFQIR